MKCWSSFQVLGARVDRRAARQSAAAGNGDRHPGRFYVRGPTDKNVPIFVARTRFVWLPVPSSPSIEPPAWRLPSAWFHKFAIVCRPIISRPLPRGRGSECFANKPFPGRMDDRYGLWGKDLLNTRAF